MKLSSRRNQKETQRERVAGNLLLRGQEASARRVQRLGKGQEKKGAMTGERNNELKKQPMAGTDRQGQEKSERRRSLMKIKKRGKYWHSNRPPQG